MAALKNNRHEKACQHYVLKGCSKADAYRHAFPTATKRWKACTVHQRASELFAQDDVKARIDELRIEVAQIAEDEFQVDAKYVLRRLVEIDRMDVADILTDDHALKPVNEWPEVWRQFVSGMDLTELFEGYGNDRTNIGILKKLKWPDKVRNLELLGKHVDVAAFKDRHEHTGKDGAPLLPTRIEIVAGGVDGTD